MVRHDQISVKRNHSTTEQEVATWPLRNTQPLVEWHPNGQVATASCSDFVVLYCTPFAFNTVSPVGRISEFHAVGSGFAIDGPSQNPSAAARGSPPTHAALNEAGQGHLISELAAGF